MLINFNVPGTKGFDTSNLKHYLFKTLADLFYLRRNVSAMQKKTTKKTSQLKTE